MMIDNDSANNQAAFLRCIGEPTRLQIIHLLTGGEMCVNDIVNHMNKAQPLISHHLKALKHCNIVTERQDAQKVYYRLADPRLACFVRDVQSMMADLSLCSPFSPDRYIEAIKCSEHDGGPVTLQP